MMAFVPIVLRKSHIKQHTDRPTGALILQYAGRGLRWVDRLYGFDEGVFFVVLPTEVPFPEALEELAKECGVALASHPAAPVLRRAVADAIVAEALVNAPSLLANIAEPRTEWGRIDLREVERKHFIEVARVSEIVRQIESDLRLRRALREPPPVLPVIAPPVVAPLGSDCRPAGNVPESPPPCAPASAIDSGASSAAVRRAEEATRVARENELPQRLPEGARRALQKMEPGVYAIASGAYDRKVDLCSAMSEAQEVSRRRDHEVVVVDWDGEWPVVVRRYGEGGRIVYRVEDALRRAGIEEAA